jgi:chromosome segregation ATPase
MNKWILTLFLFTLFSCNYVKKRAVKDDLIKAYSTEIEFLKLSINEERLNKDMRINEYKLLLTEKTMYNRVIFLQEKLKLNTDEYKSKIDQLDSEIKKIKNQISDSSIYIDSINQQLEFYKNKLDLIKENDFDCDTEMKNIEVLNKKTQDRENAAKMKEENYNELLNDKERRTNEMRKLEEEMLDLMKKLNIKHSTTQK